MRPRNTQKKGFISSVAPCYHPLQFLIYIGPWCWEGSKTLVLICTVGFNFLVDIIISKPGRVLRRSQGNQGAYSVRSPRCSRTLWLQSQRRAGDIKWMLEIRILDWLKQIEHSVRHPIGQIMNFVCNLHWKWCQGEMDRPLCCPKRGESFDPLLNSGFVHQDHLGWDLDQVKWYSRTGPPCPSS